MIAILILWILKINHSFIWVQSVTLCFQLEDLFKSPILIWARLNFVHAQYYYFGIFSFAQFHKFHFQRQLWLHRSLLLLLLLRLYYKRCVCVSAFTFNCCMQPRDTMAAPALVSSHYYWPLIWMNIWRIQKSDRTEHLPHGLRHKCVDSYFDWWLCGMS